MQMYICIQLAWSPKNPRKIPYNVSTTRNPSMKKPFRSFLVVLLALVVFFPVALQAQNQAKRIAIVPFEARGSEIAASLVDGIRIMLSSRLAAHGGVEIVDHGRVETAFAAGGHDAGSLGKTLDADFLVTGTITTIGGGYSLDTKVVPTADPASAQSFYANAATQNDLISAVTQLSRSISEGAFGAAPQAAPSESVAALPTTTGQSPYQTSHPDRQFRSARSGALGSSFIRPGMDTAGDFSKSQNFNMALQAMDIGDVDGDGQDEIVLADRNRVEIYRKDETRLIKVGAFAGQARYKIHAITVADLNGNGRAEIVVSAADVKTPNSAIFEWDGKGFMPVVENAPWYLRAMPMPGEGLVLAGQKSSMTRAIESGLFRLQINGNAVAAEDKLTVPDVVNLFEFSVADLDNDGSKEIIAIDEYDRLKVMRSGGTVLWQSDEHFGGSTRFIGGEEAFETSRLITGNDTDERLYIPSRIIIADINNDSLPDVVLNKNLSSASRVLKNMKNYPSGEIHALTWNGISLSELWRTRKIDGYIADYQLKPNAENTGADLLVGLVLQRGGISFLASKESTILTYQVDFSE